MYASGCWLTLATLLLASTLSSSASQPGLSSGSSQTFSLSPEQPVILSLDVHAGEFLQATFDSRGTLSEFSIVDSAGRLVGGGERQGGLLTPIVWATVVVDPTRLTITVTSSEAAGTTRPYAIRLDARRPSASIDAGRVEATRLMARAEELERSGAAQSSSALSAYQEAAARWRDAGDTRGEALALAEAGRLQGDLGRTPEAERSFTQAIAMCQPLGDSACEGVGLHRLGRLYAVTGRPDQGFTALQQALELRKRLGDTAAQSETLMELGGLEATRSQNPRADAFFEEAIALARSAGDRRTEADATNMRGVMHGAMGNLDQTRELYERALALRRLIHDQAGEGQSTSNLGVLYRTMGDARRAIEFYTDALGIRRRLGALQPIANTIHNLGVAHADLGEHERALDLFNEAVTIYQQTGGRRGEAFGLQAIGQSYSRMGDSARALELYARATPAWKAVGDRRGEAQTLLAAAALRAGRREFAAALEHYATALELARGAGYKRETGMALVGRAAVERTQGQLDAALADAQEAHALLSDIGDRREAGRALAEVGATHFAANRLADADAATRTAIGLFEEVEDRAEEAATRSRLARISEQRGNSSDARRQALASLDLVESVRANILSEGLNLSLFASKRALYEEAIQLLMRAHAASSTSGNDVQAFAVSERMRARGLLDLLASGEVRAQADDTTIVAELRRVQELINAKATRLTRLLAASAGKTTPAIAATRREVDDLLARLDRVRADAKQQSADLDEWSRPEPLTLAQVQAHLDANTVVLEFVIGASRSYGWAIANDTHRTFEIPARADLARLVGAAYKGLEGSPSSFNASLEGLSRALLAPVASVLRGRTRVVIVADGPLQSLPFAALPWPGRANARLDAAHEVVYLPSASVRAALRTRATTRPARSERIAVFADPVFAADDLRLASARPIDSGSEVPLPRLRFSTLEADTISKAAPARTTVWSSFAATRAATLETRLSDFGVIHFATHAVIDEERPQLSGVMLSRVDRDGRPQNGLVRMHEVYNLGLNARLVVLSACRTAAGRHVEGEGLIGLARGFLHAGADAVLATLWDVDDRATAEFMSRFYDGFITRGQSPAAALRAAQQAQRKDPRWADPKDWAGFVLIGYSR